MKLALFTVLSLFASHAFADETVVRLDVAKSEIRGLIGDGYTGDGCAVTVGENDKTSGPHLQIELVIGRSARTRTLYGDTVYRKYYENSTTEDYYYGNTDWADDFHIRYFKSTGITLVHMYNRNDSGVICETSSNRSRARY